MTFAEKLRAINAQKEVEFKEAVKAEIERIRTDLEKKVTDENINQYLLDVESYDPKKKTWILTGLSTEGLIVEPKDNKTMILKWN